MPAPRRRAAADGEARADAVGAPPLRPSLDRGLDAVGGFVPIGEAPPGWATRGAQGLGFPALPPLPGLSPSASVPTPTDSPLAPILPPEPPPTGRDASGPSLHVGLSHGAPPTLPGRLDPAVARPFGDASAPGLGRAQPAPRRALATPAHGAAYVLDVDALRRLVGDNDRVVRELLLDYLQLAGRHARDLREAAQVNDAERVAWVARQFKGISRAVGAAELVDVCSALETPSRDAASAAQQLAWFDRAFSAVCGRIDDALRSASP
jgi:HPt (histidine-containing phosphotransfer) domain-containing protein